MNNNFNRRIWLLLLIIFTLFSLADYFQRYFSPYYPRPVHWYSDLLLFQLFYWVPLFLLTVLIFRLVRHIAIEKPHRTRNLIIYIALSAIHVLVYSLLLAFYRSFKGSELAENATFADLYYEMLARIATLALFDFFAIVALAHAFRFYMQFQEREKDASELQLKTSQLETQLARAQLQSLRMQIHPHFLFNTLHSVAGLIREDRRSAAINMISGLADLLRQSLNQAGAQDVTLKEELEFLQKYLDIEQFRFQDRLAVRITVDPETLGAKVPFMILQPLVENAIRHGIAARANASMLEIRASRANGQLILEVHDDGPGIGNGITLFKGIGLNNVRARLDRIYGHRHNFALKNRTEGGAVASIEIPFALKQDSVAEEVVLQ